MLFPFLCSSLIVLELPASSSTVLRIEDLILLEANGREIRLVDNARINNTAMLRVSNLKRNNPGPYVKPSFFNQRLIYVTTLN